jgi:putative membrane protein
MKNLSIWLIASISIIILSAGCGNSAKNDSKARAINENNTRDSGEKDYPNSRMEISGADAKFAVEAADGGRAEVELGKLAMEKATDASIKNFGAMMVKDHAKANAELKQLAADKKITLPDSLGQDAQKLKKELSAKSGSEFDEAYVKAMVDDHKNDIKTFEEAKNVAKYPEMTAFISKTLPILKMHLNAIKKIQDQMKL